MRYRYQYCNAGNDLKMPRLGLGNHQLVEQTSTIRKKTKKKKKNVGPDLTFLALVVS